MKALGVFYRLHTGLAGYDTMSINDRKAQISLRDDMLVLDRDNIRTHYRHAYQPKRAKGRLSFCIPSDEFCIGRGSTSTTQMEHAQLGPREGPRLVTAEEE